MCGIAGSVGFPLDMSIVREKMGHRGPDGNGAFSDDRVHLCHLRLAILDIAGGAQPMHFADRYAIIFNGEIYNHLEVRGRLGLTCFSNSDTETILAAYAKAGPACLDYFDGMFAFCIYDRLEGKLFIARDRAGKKPFYYFLNDQKLVFASELNLLRACLPLEMNLNNFPLYLRFGTFWTGQTPYRQVQELAPGSWMEFDVHSLQCTVKRWWRITDFFNQPQRKISLEQALEQTDQLLQMAIKRRLESSDLEVGSFLSGGIDSGLVTAIAAKLRPGLRTFTVRFQGTFDEGPLARQVAERYGTKHTELKIDMNGLPNELEGILSHFGEPFFDSSAIPSWYVSREARKYLTVILNGDGADEQFAGYRRHLLFAKSNFFRTWPPMQALASVLAGLLPPGHQKKSAYNLFYRALFLSSRKGASVFAAAGSDIFEGFEHHFLIPEQAYNEPLKKIEAIIAHHGGSGLRQLLELDFDISLPCDYLVKMDMATMAHSLEGRSPFLAKEILEFVPGLPDAYKINNGQTKFLLRRLAAKYLPANIVNQPKRGFEVPLKEWVNKDFKDIVFGYLQAPNALFPQLIEKTYVDKLLEGRIRISEEKRAKQLFTLLAMEVWYKKSYCNV